MLGSQVTAKAAGPGTVAIGSTHWMLLQAPQKEFWSVFVSVYHLFLCVQAPLMGQVKYLSGLLRFLLRVRPSLSPGLTQ